MLALAAGIATAMLAGCEPTCAETCRHALDCDLESDRVSQLECEDACQAQQELYEAWEDEEKRDLFAEHKACVVDATCRELADGECYRNALFVLE